MWNINSNGFGHQAPSYTSLTVLNCLTLYCMVDMLGRRHYQTKPRKSHRVQAVPAELPCSGPHHSYPFGEAISVSSPSSFAAALPKSARLKEKHRCPCTLASCLDFFPLLTLSKGGRQPPAWRLYLFRLNACLSVYILLAVFFCWWCLLQPRNKTRWKDVILVDISSSHMVRGTMARSK